MHYGRPAGRRPLLLLGMAGAAVMILTLTACGSAQPAARSAAGEPQTAATGSQGVSAQIRGDMEVINARIPVPPVGSATAQVEMTLADTSTAGPDTLRGASSPAARAVVFVITGWTVPQILVPVVAGSSLSTGPPNPDRIVLTGLRRPLRTGQTVTISLTFARAGQATLQIPVIPSAQ